MKEMRNRILRITQDLNTLQEEIAQVRQQHACELAIEFRSSVDSMRRWLWLNTEDASLNRIPQADQDFKGRLSVGISANPSSGSFIEKVEAIVAENTFTADRLDCGSGYVFTGLDLEMTISPVP